MTGKDLLIVLLAAGAAGAGGGIGAAMVAHPGTPPEDAAAREAQLARIETALARISTDQEEAKRSVATLQERVTGLQMDVGTARREIQQAVAGGAPADPAEEDARPGRAARPRFDLAGRIEDLEIKPADVRRTRAGVRFGSALTGETLQVAEQLSRRFEGLGTGLRLRMLPEEKRWEQARTDLGLNDGQVAQLKQAIADRDAALEGSMAVETTGEGTAQQITIKRMDPLKAAAAQQDYDRKVASTLDQAQKCKWDEKGYGHAFGGSPGGGLAVIHAVDVNLAEDHSEDAGE